MSPSPTSCSLPGSYMSGFLQHQLILYWEVFYSCSATHTHRPELWCKKKNPPKMLSLNHSTPVPRSACAAIGLASTLNQMGPSHCPQHPHCPGCWDSQHLTSLQMNSPPGCGGGLPGPGASGLPGLGAPGLPRLAGRKPNTRLVASQGHDSTDTLRMSLLPLGAAFQPSASVSLACAT